MTKKNRPRFTDEILLEAMLQLIENGEVNPYLVKEIKEAKETYGRVRAA